MSLATTLRDLHVPGTPLVLPNAWDVASARMVEQAGFPAIATKSSFATATILGYDDGEQAPVDEVLAAATRIARSVSVPVTVDFERGYRFPPAELVERFTATGAVGLNLEDSDPSTGTLVDPSEQADFLAAVRAAAGAGLVINARVDTFIRPAGSPGEQLRAAIDRAARYLAAGADCVYPIGTGDPDVVQTLVEEIPGPVNVSYGQGDRSVAELTGLGVARITFGPMLQRHTYLRLAGSILPALGSGGNPFTG
ncbi:isocitrate lyase/phosphoenolpyruvate mutase family protein [Kribbella turkmenica]|uniref:Isocitrate lyase/phosphoenolpyruvate mutase family protein n=1 Tax=Kribbella turkmenica TaxID=2530375 RepID=A0A4R4WS28_9ACTN|nr:isocitrate lyase/phosphoenolpyruvate mutase family protein [Kribbella turkmenica]TDD19990.1 isocitrate lyase/phosphoenolpyruvate mutase family protein [Kribbella turkmenica]